MTDVHRMVVGRAPVTLEFYRETVLLGTQRVETPCIAVLAPLVDRADSILVRHDDGSIAAMQVRFRNPEASSER